MALGRWGIGISTGRGGRTSRQAFTGARRPTTTVSGATAGEGGIYSEIGEEIYGAREEARGEQREEYEAAKAQADAAYEAGLMSKAEYEEELATSREEIEGQYAALGRQMGETTYGLGLGARRGGQREIAMGRIGAIGAGARGVRTERRGLRGAAASEKAGRYAQLFGMYQTPYEEIPTGLGPKTYYTALTGKKYKPKTTTTRRKATYRSTYA